MFRFLVWCLFAVLVIGFLRLGQDIAIAGSLGSPKGNGPLPEEEVWNVQYHALCKPVEACMPKLCNAQTTGECSFERTPIENAEHKEECESVAQFFTSCSTRQGSGSSCVMHTAQCGVVEHTSKSGQIYYTCEAILIGINDFGPRVKECKDLSLF